MTSNKEKDRNAVRRVLREKRLRRVRRVKMCLRILALLLICMTPLLFLTTATASRQEASVYLKLKEASMIQGEELPAFQVEADLVGSKETILDGESGYTAADLVRDFENGKGYEVECEADTAAKGEYPMHLKLSDEIQTALDKEWVGSDRKERCRRMGRRPVQTSRRLLCDQ